MGKLLRNVGFFIVVAVLTWGIFLLVTPNKKAKQDVLAYSLDLLGKKLLSMVPDQAEQASVDAEYKEFVKKATRREISPEQVKRVAANIINVSNAEKHLSEEEACHVITVAIDENQDSVRTIERAKDEPPPKPKITRIKKWKFKRQPDDDQWDELGEQLSSIYKVNEKMQEIITENVAQNRHLPEDVHYLVESGLNLAMDMRLKHKLHEKEYARLARELSHLEKEKMLIWRENFQEEMENLQIELESLRELGQLKELEGLESLKSLEALKSLESLRALENLRALKDIPILDSDSIQKIVEKSLEEAGIPTDK